MPQVRAEDLALTDLITDAPERHDRDFEIVSLRRVAGGVEVCTQPLAWRPSRRVKGQVCETVAVGKGFLVRAVRSVEPEGKRLERIYYQRAFARSL